MTARPAPRKAPRESVVIGIDVGGTSIKSGFVSRDGAVFSPRRVPTRPERGPDAVIGLILDLAERLIRRPGPDGEPAAAVGLAVPGIVDVDRGIAVRSVNLGWTNAPLLRLVQERVGVPTALGHDVRAAALAEGAVGAAAGARDFLFVALGAGVGAAVILGKAPLEGANHRGGELGHVRISKNGPRCRCGAKGCIESFASGRSIESRYRRASEEVDVSAAEVVRRAAAGDPMARRVWGEAVGALAAGLANYITLLDPEVVVVGGGVASAGRALFDPLVRSVRANVPPFVVPPPIVPGALGVFAGCSGAGVLGWSRLGVA